MSTRRARLFVLLLTLGLVAAGCGDDDATDTTPASTAAPTSTAAPSTTQTTAAAATTTVAEITTTTEAASTTEAMGAVTFGDPDGNGHIPVTISDHALDSAFNAFNDDNPSDPFYQIHTQGSDLFIGVEMYTMYGAEWTGEEGTFPTDCVTHGICVYFDPDGTGPASVMGPGTGEITISQLGDGTLVALEGVVFVDASGTTYVMSGVTLGG